MSCIGVDLGTSRTVIAVARNRGVDTICNEVSNRATPSMVTFGSKQRYLGEAAKTQEISNFRSSVSSLRRLLGLSANSPADVETFARERLFVNCPMELQEEGVCYNVSYLDEMQEFSAVETMAMFLGRIRDTAHAEVKVPVTDMVLAVPAYFTERQRRCLQDAAAIANVNITRMISEPGAIALSYGMPRAELAADEVGERIVCFVDCGAASTTVSVVAFSKGKAEVKAVAYDSSLGGRDFDALLAEHFGRELHAKGMSIAENAKARFRLRGACERAKKILSANLVAVVNVENLANDRDFSSSIKREEFEAMATPLLERLQKVILGAFASVDIASVHSVEIVGGSTRIPAIKELIKSIFGKEPCTTLNQDEAIARGCALQSALLSPTFRVKEYSLSDLNLFERRFMWQPQEADDDGVGAAFPVGNAIPSTKLLTFSPRPLPFDVAAYYVRDGQNILIGSARIDSSVDAGAQGVKLKVRLNPSHLVSFEGVSWPDGTNTGLTLTANYEALSMSKQQVNQLREQEANMAANDKLVADTADRKNALEEYIYEMRNKLDVSSGALAKFAAPEESAKLLALCGETEEWLYSVDGEDAAKSVYVGKLDALRKIGEPIARRFQEAEERPEVENALRATIKEYSDKAASPLYDYLGSDDLAKVTAACQKSLQWLDSQLQALEKLAPHQNPTVTVQSMRLERERLIATVVPILSKPRPKPAATTPTTPSSTSETPKSEESKQQEEEEHGCCNDENCGDFEHCHDGMDVDYEEEEEHDGCGCGHAH